MFDTAALECPVPRDRDVAETQVAPEDAKAAAAAAADKLVGIVVRDGRINNREGALVGVGNSSAADSLVSGDSRIQDSMVRPPVEDDAPAPALAVVEAPKEVAVV